MRDEQVVARDRLTAQLAVEHHPAGGEAAAAHDLEHAERHVLDRGGEQIEVPPEPIVAGVGVDRPEDAGVDRRRDLVVEVVTRECRVVGLDVDLDLVLEAVLLEKGVHRRDVVVVLVLGGLHALRLDEQCPLEPDRVLVLDDHVHEATELIEFARHVGVEERLVALATAPQHVVGAAEVVRSLHAVGHLGGGVHEQIGVGVGGGTRHEAAVREGVGGAPHQLDVGVGHLLAGVVDHLVEVPARLGEGVAGGCDVDVVERVEPDAELGDELERGVHLHPGGVHRIEIGRVVGVPRSVERAGAEDVETIPGERVPVADGEAEVLGHRAVADHAVGLVPAEGQRVVAVGTLVLDGVDGFEEAHGIASRR